MEKIIYFCQAVSIFPSQNYSLVAKCKFGIPSGLMMSTVDFGSGGPPFLAQLSNLFLIANFLFSFLSMAYPHLFSFGHCFDPWQYGKFKALNMNVFELKVLPSTFVNTKLSL